MGGLTEKKTLDPQIQKPHRTCFWAACTGKRIWALELQTFRFLGSCLFFLLSVSLLICVHFLQLRGRLSDPYVPCLHRVSLYRDLSVHCLLAYYIDFDYEEKDIFKQIFFSCIIFCLTQLKTVFQHYCDIKIIESLDC